MYDHTIRKNILWVLGRLDELRVAGLVTSRNAVRVTADGRDAYLILKSTGYRSSEDDVKECLDMLGLCEPESQEAMVQLICKCETNQQEN